MASFSRHCDLFMYFMAYILDVSRFWTMHTCNGNDSDSKHSPKDAEKKTTPPHLAETALADDAQHVEVIEVDCKKKEIQSKCSCP